MREIHLAHTKISFFRSFRKVEVAFPESGGFRFISGSNQVEPRLGANGAGKSTLWDAVFWCFYGVSLRGLRASDLVTWGEERCGVSCTLRIDEHEHKILRLSNPNKLAINGQPVDQKAVNDLLGLSAIRFRHSVIFGQAVPLFPDLDVPARVTLLEEALDLALWGRLSDRAARKLGQLNAEVVAANLQLAEAEGQLKAIASADIDGLEKEERLWADERKEKLKAAITKQNQLADLHDKACYEYEEIKAKLSLLEQQREPEGLQELREQLRGLEHGLSEWQRNAHKAHELIEWYDNAEDCPTCRQLISPRFKLKTVADLKGQARLAEPRIAKLQAQIKAQQAAITQLEEETDKAKIAIYETAGARRMAAQRVEIANQQYRDAYASVQALSADIPNPYTKRLDSLVKAESDALKLRARVNKSKLRLKGQMAVGEYWKQGFKKVRLFQIKRVLDYLTLEVSNAASSLGLDGWHISFVTETETKSGTSKMGVQIVVSSPSGGQTIWEAWSGGEGQRLRLAIAIGLSTTIQRLSGVKWDLEVWDEPSAWLSAEGIEDLLETLSNRSLRAKRSIYICDHTALTFTGFSEVWSVVKTQEGSKVIQP
jgi:DNA repair exonuclease SbcCD ATPase subunit